MRRRLQCVAASGFWRVVRRTTIETISGQVEDRFGDRSYDRMTQARDRAQLAVLAAREAAREAGA
jgi:ketoreductase RED1